MRLLSKYDNAKRKFKQNLQKFKNASDKFTAKIRKIPVKSPPTTLPYQSYAINKLSWIVGTKVLYQKIECIIIEILCITPNKPDFEDDIKVKFNNGIIKIYPRSSLQSTQKYILNKRKLTRGLSWVQRNRICTN
eukprot:423315_1